MPFLGNEFLKFSDELFDNDVIYRDDSYYDQIKKKK